MISTRRGWKKQPFHNLSGLKWTPAVLSPSLWLKADAGITMDASNRVSLWADQGSGGNNFAQAGADGIKPVWAGNVANGLPGVLFTSASSQFLNNTSLDATFDGADKAVEVALVAKHPAGPSATEIYFYMEGVNARVGVYRGATGTLRTARRDDAAASKANDSVATYVGTSPTILMYSCTGTLGSSWINSTSVTSGVDQDVGTMTLTASYLGRYSAGSYLNGHLFEILVFASVLSAENRAAVYRYLARRWGLS